MLLQAESTRAGMSNPLALPILLSQNGREAGPQQRSNSSSLCPWSEESWKYGELGPGRARTCPYLARATDKGPQRQWLHGTRALLPASAGTGQFLLHGISQAGRRARHRGEVGKSWCVWQDFSRGFIAAGERGSRKGKTRTERRGGEREKKQKSFGVRALRTHHPVQEAWHPPFTCWHLLASPCLQTPGQGCSMEKWALKLRDEAAPTGMSRAKQPEPKESKPEQWGGGSGAAQRLGR